MRLHGFFRSSSAYRVRIVMAMKGLSYDQSFYVLRRGDQRQPDYLKLNPQGFVPSLELDDGTALTQSLAIIDYLDETHPEPALLPRDAILRARIRAFALAIACDLHPVQNLGVLNAVRKLGHGDAEVNDWARRVNQEGLDACEALLADAPGPFCFGDAPTLADVCLVPQLFNARRFGCDLSHWTRLLAAEAACLALPAFSDTAPERQPDAE
jgi:maleylpyruvate isomerase